MRPCVKALLLFLLLMFLFPVIGILVDALESGFHELAWWEWALIAALPVLVWLWLRHFSMLFCEDTCRLPAEDAHDPNA